MTTTAPAVPVQAPSVTPPVADIARRIVEETTAAQDLPLQVTDPTILRQVAQLLGPRND